MKVRIQEFFKRADIETIVTCGAVVVGSASALLYTVGYFIRALKK